MSKRVHLHRAKLTNSELSSSSSLDETLASRVYTTSQDAGNISLKQKKRRSSDDRMLQVKSEDLGVNTQRRTKGKKKKLNPNRGSGAVERAHHLSQTTVKRRKRSTDE
eukprot:TRINITY_DN12972_c0_g1_i1.p1 TRINITY_DN12972_c0_g1~~TRINITY_DN12972_c0_g1_i1.p1  ORF type:complete len:108 (-),score=22.49 TRINITY_DN12972_c0_g1_i1:42-365(-)